MSRSLHSLAIACGLALGALIGSGLGMASLPLVLPAMLADLGWSHWHGGLLAAATAGGYVTGLVLTLPQHRAMPAGRVFRLALLVTVGSLLATGAARDVNHVVFLRFISGMAAAALMVSGGRLSAAIFVYEPAQSARMVRVFEAALPAGVVATGVVVPSLLATLGHRGWPETWLVLGLFAACALPFAIWSCRRVVAPAPRPAPNEWPSRRFVPLIAARALFAASAAAAVTFLVLAAVEKEAGVGTVAAIWIVLGLGGLVAPAVWGYAVDLGQERRIALAIAMAGVGSGLVAIAGSAPAVLIAAAAIMGIGGGAVPYLMSGYVIDTLDREAREPALSGLAVVHGFSLPIGPLVAAWVADGRHGLQGSYLLAAAALLLAAGAAFLQQTYMEWMRSAPAGPRVPEA